MIKRLFFLIIVLFISGCTAAPPPATEPASQPVSTEEPFTVPSAPNVTLITANVLAVTNTENGILVDLEITESNPVSGSPGFGINLAGEKVTAKLVDENVDLSNPGGVTISGELSYEGDEQSGIYLLRNVQVIENMNNPNGPSGVPVAPNASRILATIISVNTAQDGLYLELEVIEANPIPDYLNMGEFVVGKQITVKVIDESVGLSFVAGQTISAELRYEGDEQTGLYLLTAISKE